MKCWQHAVRFGLHRLTLRRSTCAAGLLGTTLLTMSAGTVWGATDACSWTNFVGQPATDGFADGFGTDARFSRSYGIALDGTGNIYVADTWNCAIRKVTLAGQVLTLAGNSGISGSNDGTGTEARFNLPSGITVDATGTIYVADSHNHTIRQVTPDGTVTTLAGTAGSSGSTDGTGPDARFNVPYGIAADAAGTLYVSDSLNHSIRRIAPDGTVSTLAGGAGVSGSTDGTGSDARFNHPEGVAVDADGNVYVADAYNHTIRKVTAAGVVTTLAGSPGVSGSADGTGSAARFDQPSGIAIDSAGTLYVGDTLNETIRRITPAGVVTIIGGSPGAVGTDDGIGAAARFDWPMGVAVDGAGNLYVADEGNSRISIGTPAWPLIGTESPLPDGTAGVAYDQTLTAAGGTPPYTWSVISGSLPSGLSLSSDGQISGTPDTVTANVFTVQVAGVDGATSTKDFSLTIFGPPNDMFWDAIGLFGASGQTMGSNVAASSEAGEPSHAGFPATASVWWYWVPATSGWGVVDTFGSSFDTVLAVYTGESIEALTPVAANDDYGRLQSRVGFAAAAGTVYWIAVDGREGATGSITLNWNLLLAPSITTASPLPDGTVGVAYNQTLTATGGQPPYTWSVVSGSLPAGLTLAGDGTISGTPTAGTACTFTVQVIDADFVPCTQAFALTIGRGYYWANFVGQRGGWGNANGMGGNARFQQPSGVVTDSMGNLYVADSQNHTIRKVTPSGAVTTLAGLAGSPGSADGTGEAARFNLPHGVAVDGTGNVFVADFGNHTIRKVTPGGAVTTVAGQAGSTGSTDGTGAAARFRLPEGVALDSEGNIYVADTWNDTIRKVTPAGDVTTLAGLAGSQGSADGTGNAARFQAPSAVAVDGADIVYVTDDQTIRRVTPSGEVTTLAGRAGSWGSADGAGSDARFFGPSGVAVDGKGTLYVADAANSTIRKVTSVGVVTTLAGQADSWGSADGVGRAARFWRPAGVSVDTAGNVYVADTGNSTIRKVTPAGIVSTLAGLASAPGSADGVGSAAGFNSPVGVAVDSAGTAYVVDSHNDTIRRITPAAVVTTLAGLPTMLGSADGAGPAAEFDQPAGLTLDSAGNVYVADEDNYTIRKITAAGAVTTIAGLAGFAGSDDGVGSAARFYHPYGIVADGAGNVYVSDSVNKTIRRITPDGMVTTLAGLAQAMGSADGTGPAARFGTPYGLAADGAGNVYVADTGNHTIRKVTPAGVVTTLAGLAGSLGSADGMGTAARLYYPSGVAVDAAGNVFVADTVNCTIRKVTPAGAVTTIGGSPGMIGGADGIGSSANLSHPAGIAVDSGGTLYVADTYNNRIVRGTPISGPPPAPCSPAPGNGQINVPVSAALYWTMAAPGRTFDVYLDTVNPPLAKVASGMTADSLAPSLVLGTRYYWKVAATNPDGHTDGPVWSFATHLPADINGDGYVNLQDLLGLVTSWASHRGGSPSGNWNAAADLNNDNFVNIGDLQILVAHWGQSAN